MELEIGNKTEAGRIKSHDAELKFNEWDKLTIVTKFPNPQGSGFCNKYFELTCNKDGDLKLKEI